MSGDVLYVGKYDFLSFSQSLNFGLYDDEDSSDDERRSPRDASPWFVCDAYVEGEVLEFGSVQLPVDMRDLINFAAVIPACVGITSSRQLLKSISRLIPFAPDKRGCAKVWVKRSVCALQPVAAFLSLTAAHARIRVFQYGSLCDEIVEQYMTAMVLRSDDVVLELGGSVGRNTCTIAAQLRDASSFVVLECDAISARRLAVNARANGLNFAIETAALSALPMIQRLSADRFEETREWACDAPVPDGWARVQTVTLDVLRARHPVLRSLSVLVVNCERGLFGIFRDSPHILDGVRAVVLGNIFFGKDSTFMVYACLRARGFTCVWQQDYVRPFAPTGSDSIPAFWQLWIHVKLQSFP